VQHEDNLTQSRNKLNAITNCALHVACGPVSRLSMIWCTHLTAAWRRSQATETGTSPSTRVITDSGMQGPTPVSAPPIFQCCERVSCIFVLQTFSMSTHIQGEATCFCTLDGGHFRCQQGQQPRISLPSDTNLPGMSLRTCAAQSHSFSHSLIHSFTHSPAHQAPNPCAGNGRDNLIRRHTKCPDQGTQGLRPQRPYS
jgi:hypothetical protein